MQLVPVVFAMIEHDQQEYVDQAMAPMDFEVGAEGEEFRNEVRRLALEDHGRVDRVDQQSDGSRIGVGY